MEKDNGSVKGEVQNEWRLKKGLDAFGNIFALNVCFVIACLPVITIGASLAALYAMCIRLQESEEETILHGFIHEFKRNFKQATIAYLLSLVAIVVLYAEWLVVNNFKGFISTFYMILFFFELLIFSLCTTFLFPLIARYKNTLKNNIRNSFLLSIGYRFSWLKVNVAWIAPAAFSIIYPRIFLETWYMWVLFIFGAIAYGTSFTFRRVISLNQKNTEKAEEEAAEAAKQKAKEEAASKAFAEMKKRELEEDESEE